MKKIFPQTKINFPQFFPEKLAVFPRKNNRKQTIIIRQLANFVLKNQLNFNF